jgi:hypothetical protein
VTGYPCDDEIRSWPIEVRLAFLVFGADLTYIRKLMDCPKYFKEGAD